MRKLFSTRYAEKATPGEIKSLEYQLRNLKDRKDFLPRQIDVLRRELDQLPKQIAAVERQLSALRDRR
jgi:septal ring factor EnvC (AmiA/AmiB activator)